MVRMGADRISSNLPVLLREFQRKFRSILWMLGLAHEESIRETESGHRIQDFDSILSELRSFFEIHE